MTTLRHLDNNTLIDTLSKLARNEREATAELLACLAEMDRRKLYVARGYGSLFEYCLKVLHMAEPSIYVRIGAARCCRRFPAVLQMLRKGQLHLSAIKLLAPHLTEGNHQDLLAGAQYKSKRQVEQLVRDLAPTPDAKAVVRKLPTPQAAANTPVRPTAEACEAQQTATQPPTPSGSSSAPSSKPKPPAANARDASKLVSHPEPLGLNRYKVQFTADEPLRRKIEQARDLMRHKNPTGDLPALFEAALDQLIAAESKRQHGATTRPRAAKPEPAAQEPAARVNPSRHIPNNVRRQVFARDGGQCTFVSPDGHRCSQRGGLQYHHEVPFAKGGASTVENVRLLCSCHNAHHARRDYGEQWMAARVKAAQDSRSPGQRETGRSINPRSAMAHLAAAGKATTQMPLNMAGT